MDNLVYCQVMLAINLYFTLHLLPLMSVECAVEKANIIMANKPESV